MARTGGKRRAGRWAPPTAPIAGLAKNSRVSTMPLASTSVASVVISTVGSFFG